MGKRSVFPLDECMGIDGLPFKMTLTVMLKCAFWAQNQGSYQAAENILSEHFGIRINDDTIRQATNLIGRIVFDALMADAESDYAGMVSGTLSFPSGTRDGVFYIECDGAALNTRHKDENGSSWRENKLGMVFRSDDIKRYSDKKGGTFSRIDRREYASYVGGVAEFRKLLYSTALGFGYGTLRHTVFLSDGAKWISNMVAEDYPDAIHILDFFHLKENVFSFAKARFGADSKLTAPWAEEISALLLEGKSDEVLRRLDSGETYPNTVKLHDYIVFHRDHINYPYYKSMGFFIGSGAIESGNKVVLQKRLKQAGMRWETFSAQAMLTLKSMVESNRWPEVIELVEDHFGMKTSLGR
jgi:hypothetical protein